MSETLDEMMRHAISKGLTNLSIWDTGTHWCASTQWNHNSCQVDHGPDAVAALKAALTRPEAAVVPDLLVSLLPPVPAPVAGLLPR